MKLIPEVAEILRRSVGHLNWRKLAFLVQQETANQCAILAQKHEDCTVAGVEFESAAARAIRRTFGLESKTDGGKG